MSQLSDMMGGASDTNPIPMGLVIVSRYKPAARFRPMMLSPGEGVLALIENTTSIHQHPETAVNTLRRAITGAIFVKGVRGEAGTCWTVLSRTSVSSELSNDNQISFGNRCWPPPIAATACAHCALLNTAA